MDKIFYSPITYKSIYNNDNWKAGGNASTIMWSANHGGLRIGVDQFGKTKKEAQDKLIKMLNGAGKNSIECIDENSD